MSHIVQIQTQVRDAEAVRAACRRLGLPPVVQLPAELEKLFVVLDHDLPGRDQLEEIARGIATEDGELPSNGQLQTVLDAAAARATGETIGTVS